MSDQFISWLLIAEIATPLLILSIVLGWMLYSNFKKNKEAARSLILNIKNNEENEKAAILAFLSEKLGLDEESSKKMTKKIINERKFLFRNLISGLLDKNVEAIESLEGDLSRVTKRYHELNVSLSQAESEASEEETSEEDSEQVAELKEEVKSLKKEIHITLTTLNNIFGEFSSMFGEEVPESEMSVDQIITAMEAFSGKSQSESEDEVEPEAAAETIESNEEEPDAFAEVETALEEIAEESESEPAIVSSDDETAVKETVEADDSEEAAPEPGLEALEAVDDQGDVFDASEPLSDDGDSTDEDASETEALDFSIDDELDDIDSALDDLELGSSDDAEPSWDDAFEESGDKPS